MENYLTRKNLREVNTKETDIEECLKKANKKQKIWKNSELESN